MGTPSKTKLLEDAPAWLRGVVVLGVPAAIALYLVWFGTSLIASDVRLLRSQMERHDTRSEAIATNVDAHAATSAREMQDLRVLLRQICVNTAPNETYRQGCFQAGAR